MADMFEIRELPTPPGKGLFAIQSIDAGTRILSEKPLFCVPSSPDGFCPDLIKLCVIELDKINQEIFKKLPVAPPVPGHFTRKARHPWWAIFEAGHVLIDNGELVTDTAIGAVTACAARVCEPNTSACWNVNIEEITLHAIREIAEDEQITITTFSGTRLLPHVARQRCRRFWGLYVDCKCRLCTLSPVERANLDNMLVKMLQLASLTNFIYGNELTTPQSVLSKLQYTDQLVQLCSEHSFAFEEGASSLMSMGIVLAGLGDLARASVLATRALEIYKVFRGADHPLFERISQLLDDTRHSSRMTSGLH